MVTKIVYYDANGKILSIEHFSLNPKVPENAHHFAIMNFVDMGY